MMSISSSSFFLRSCSESKELSPSLQLSFSSCHLRLQLRMQGLDLVEVFSSRFQVDVNHFFSLFLLHVLRRRLRDVLISPGSDFDGLLPLLDELLALGVQDPKLFRRAIQFYLSRGRLGRFRFHLRLNF